MLRNVLVMGVLASLPLVLGGCPTAPAVRECNPATQDPCFSEGESVAYVCDPTTRTCVRSCALDDDCLASQRCDLTDPNLGMCRAAPPASGDADDGGTGDVDLGDTTGDHDAADTN